MSEMRQWRKWVPINRPGYLGLRRDEVADQLNAQYGVNRWGYGWKYYGKYFPFAQAFETLFCRAYYEFLIDNPDALADIASYDEVMCINKNDIKSGLNYRIQRADETHLADIAIRRAMVGLGVRFYDTEIKNILHITPGHKYHPGNVPFFVPDQILKPKLSPDTTMSGTIDDFWQNNKFVMVHPDVAPVEQPIFGANNS